MTSSDAARTASKVFFQSDNFGTALAGLYKSPLYDPKLFKIDMAGLLPDYSKIMGESILSVIGKSAMTPSLLETIAPANRLADFHKELGAAGINSLAKMMGDNHAAMLKDLVPSINLIGEWAKMNNFQSSLAALGESATRGIGMPGIESLLASVGTIREELDDQELEELTDEFFDSHPDLAASIEQSPVLRALSKADRRLIVWFVGIIVTLYVGNALLHVGTDYPDVKAMIDAFGLDAGGGLPAGLAAAKLTDKALDKLPQDED